MEVPPPFFLLLPLAGAAGLDLYLTLLAVIGLGLSGSGFMDAAGLSFSTGAPAIMGLAALYLLEAFADLRASLALGWHALQLLIRPAGAGLLALHLLQGEPPAVLLAGVLMAGIVGAFSHVLLFGQAILIRLAPNPRLTPGKLILLSDLLAIALLTSAVFIPDWAPLGTILLLLLGLILGRDHHGAVRFGLALLADKFWGIVSPTRWLEVGRFPPWVRSTLPPEPVNTIRGAPGATWGLAHPGGFRNGWVIKRNDELFFAFRRGRTVRTLPLTGTREGTEVGPLARIIRFSSPEGPQSALFLQVGLNAPESHK